MIHRGLSSILPVFALSMLANTRCLAQVSADPEQYAYYPDSTLALGLGFDPEDLKAAKAPCIIGQHRKLDAGPASTTLSAVYVTNYQQLADALNIDVNIEVSSLTAHSSAAIDYASSHQFSDTSATLVISATTDYGKWGLAPPITLTDEAKHLLSTPGDFAKVCGSRYVAIERHASALHAILTVESLSQTEKEQIEAKASGGGGGGAISMSGSVSVNHTIQQASREGRLSVEVSEVGGGGIGDLSALVSASAGGKDSLEDVGKTLGDVVKGFKESNAAAISYMVASMEQLGWNPLPFRLTDKIKQFMLEMYLNYHIIDKGLAGNIGMLSDNDPRSAYLTAETKDAILRDNDELRQRMTAIETMFADCAGDDVHACTTFAARPTGSLSVLLETPVWMLDSNIRAPHVYLSINSHDPNIQIPSQSVNVIASNPPDGRLDALRNILPSAENVGIGINVDSSWNTSEQWFYRDDETAGSELPVTQPMAQLPRISSSSGLWYCDGSCGQQTQSGRILQTENVIRSWMAGWPGHHTGTILLRFKDILGHSTDVDVLSTEWTSDSGKLAVVKAEITL